MYIYKDFLFIYNLCFDYFSFRNFLLGYNTNISSDTNVV